MASRSGHPPRVQIPGVISWLHNLGQVRRYSVSGFSNQFNPFLPNTNYMPCSRHGQPKSGSKGKI